MEAAQCGSWVGRLALAGNPQKLLSVLEPHTEFCCQVL